MSIVDENRIAVNTKTESTAAKATQPSAAAPLRKIAISTTARGHTGIRRLPDRLGATGPIESYLVEDEADVRDFLQEVDQPGVELFVDVERKRPLDLWAAVKTYSRQATLTAIKPNDLTVEATDATILHLFGQCLTGRAILIVGTGNIAFKTALRLAERGATVAIYGRTPEKVEAVVHAIRTFLPAYADKSLVYAWRQDSAPADALVSAITATGALGSSWVTALRPTGVLLDIGLDNFSPELIQAAGQHGLKVLRLDVRAAGFPHRANFFVDIHGQREIAGRTVVAGGIVGLLGVVVVDRIDHPSRVIGIANGTGGLLPPAQWRAVDFEAVNSVETWMRENEKSR